MRSSGTGHLLMWFGRTPDAHLYHLMPHPCHFNFALHSPSLLLPTSSLQVAILSPHLHLFIPFTTFLSNTNAWLLLFPAGSVDTRPGVKDVAPNTCDGVTPACTTAEGKIKDSNQESHLWREEQPVYHWAKKWHPETLRKGSCNAGLV